MPHVLRLHQSQNGTDWFVSTQLTTSQIADIVDPDGENARKPITSIPSPLARMELVRNAFEMLTKRNNVKDLEGNNIYHKTVSDALDVGQLIFSKQRLGGQVSLFRWDKAQGLKSLNESGNVGHRRLGRSLELYFAQDGAQYNIPEMPAIYIVKFGHIIVGGTSPITLFFSPANDLTRASIKLGNDVLFDDQYSPLYRRQEDYIRFIFLFRKIFNNVNPAGFAAKFKSINDYLELNLKALQTHNPTLHLQLMNLQESDWNDLDLLEANEGNVEILGVPLKGAHPATATNAVRDSFKVNATVQAEQLPLALQKGYGMGHHYVENVAWDPTWDVPVFDPKPLEERLLPHQAGIKYPYLTANDLFEPYLVGLPYSINTEHYQGINMPGQGKSVIGYLLPLKPAVFKYFKVADVVVLQPGESPRDPSKLAIQLEQVANGIHARLYVPIQAKHHVRYERFYQQSGGTVVQPSEQDNRGVVAVALAGISMMPWVEQAPETALYNVQLIDQDGAQVNWEANFLKQGKPLAIEDRHKHTRATKPIAGANTVFYLIENQTFDAIQLRAGAMKGLLLPIFKPKSVSEVFRFAMDFGTTNTHVEYSAESNPLQEKPLTIGPDDIHVASTFDRSKVAEQEAWYTNLHGQEYPLVYKLVAHEFLPWLIGTADSEYAFPHRTVLLHGNTLDLNQDIAPFHKANIGAVYGKDVTQSHTRVVTDLKWSGAGNMAKAFIESVMVMMRNKVLMNNGNLSKTELIYFYPTSMPVGRRHALDQVWADAYKRYFGGDPQLLKGYAESLAPFHYYNTKGGILGTKTVSIDIGGGTTDVVFFQNGEPKAHTSFRFAGNALFGNGYNATINSNGFVQHFIKEYQALLQGDAQLAASLQQIIDSGKSEEAIAFFFGLSQNTRVVKLGWKDAADFMGKLSKSPHMKMPVLLFISAIFYHIANWVKALNLPVPTEILFSGRGSVVLGVLPNDSLQGLALRFFEKVFEDAQGQAQAQQVAADPSDPFGGATKSKNTLPSSIAVRIEGKPKEITSKGGLFIKQLQPSVHKTLLGIPQPFITEEKGYRYEQLSGTDPEVIAQEVYKEELRFLTMLNAIHRDFNFVSYFGVDGAAWKEARELAQEQGAFEGWVLKGLLASLATYSNNQDAVVNESLFFYGLFGYLNQLAFRCHLSNQKG